MDPWPTLYHAPALRQLLADSEPGVRALAAEALATLHQPEDLPRLAVLVQDPAEALMELVAAPMPQSVRMATPEESAKFKQATPEELEQMPTQHTWHKSLVANHAAWALYTMLGECCPREVADLRQVYTAGHGGWTPPLPKDISVFTRLATGDPKDHLWYWQEYIHRALDEREYDGAKKKEWMKSFVAEMRSWPAERRAMVRLMAIYYHTGGADALYYDRPDARLFDDSLELGLPKERIYELLDGVGVWPDENLHGGGPYLVRERLVLAWKECFDAKDVPRLMALFSDSKIHESPIRVGLVIALANLMPATHAASEDPATAEGFLRRVLREDRVGFVRARAALELMRMDLGVHWALLSDVFFANKERSDEFAYHFLEWFNRAPAGDNPTRKLVELVSDERFRPLWLETEKPAGKGMSGGRCRHWAASAINIRAGRTVITDEDMKALKDPEQGSAWLKLMLKRVNEIGKTTSSVTPR